MTTKQFNARIPQITQQQIDKIARLTGMTKTQIIILAIDRLARDLTPDEMILHSDPPNSPQKL